MKYRVRTGKWIIAINCIIAINLALASLAGQANAAESVTPYADYPEVASFIDAMVKEHQFDKAYLKELFAEAEKKQSILDAIARPAEKTKPWKDYRKIFLTPERIRQGAAFWRANEDILRRAEAQYEVAPSIIVAIIGVETFYGQRAGTFRVLDALSTLAFDYPPRAEFFKKELVQFLLLTRDNKLPARELLGSYAGAMGWGQFIPSSYRAYAVDFDGDKVSDIWNNPADAIGSVANYFNRHGWRPGEPVVLPATIDKSFDEALFNDISRPALSIDELRKKGFRPADRDYHLDVNAMPIRLDGDNGEEYWLGLNNFYVITRYNRSHLYAMAAHQLSLAIEQCMKQAQCSEK